MSIQTKGNRYVGQPSPNPDSPNRSLPTPTSPIGTALTPNLQLIAQKFANDADFRRQLFAKPARTLCDYSYVCNEQELAVIEAFASTRQLIGRGEFTVIQGDDWWIDD